MAINLTSKPIAERILAQLRANLIAEFEPAGGANDIQLYDRDGNDPVATAGELPAWWLVITAADEDELGETDENHAIGTQTRRMQVTMDAHLLKKQAGITTEQQAQRMIAQINDELMADPQLVEDDTEVELAMDIQVLATFGPYANDEQRDVVCGLEAEIHYRINLADSYSVA